MESRPAAGRGAIYAADAYGCSASTLCELLQLDLDYRRSLSEEVAVDDYLLRFPQLREVIQQSFAAALEWPPAIRFLPDTMIGKYRVRTTLGVGAFAVVYLAWDSQLQREVAIKVPHRFLLADEAARQRFLEGALRWLVYDIRGS